MTERTNRNRTYVERRLPVSFRVRNIVRPKNRGAGHYENLSNMLHNLYGDPILVLERSRWSASGLFYKKNPEGEWMRFADTFYFKNKAMAALIRMYVSNELKVFDIKY